MNPLNRSLPVALLSLALWPLIAQAQIFSRPVVPPPPPVPLSSGPCVNCYGGPVYPPPLSSYSFNGPSPATYTYQYIPMTGLQADPNGVRPVTTYRLAPVLEYSRGYYRGYNSGLFFRY
jgi:hypothetical protein